MPATPSNGIDATATSLEVLEHLVEADGYTGVSEVADELGIAKSMAHNHLSTLQSLGYVVKRDRKYGPSLRPLLLGDRSRSRMDVYERGREYVENLAEATGETVELFIMEEHYGVPVAVARGAEEWSPPHRIGERTPLHATAAGKAILASLPPERMEKTLDRESLAPLTEETITAPATLREEIRDVRERGMSFCREEQYRGVVGIGAPIETGTSEQNAALAIVGPADRLHGRYFEEDLVGQVVSTATRIEVELTE